jgi:hypothetical protein
MGFPAPPSSYRCLRLTRHAGIEFHGYSVEEWAALSNEERWILEGRDETFGEFLIRRAPYLPNGRRPSS